MAKGSDNLFPSLLVVEQGSAPATPDAGNQRIYMKADHKFYHVGNDGIETEIGGGSSTVGRYRSWLYSAVGGELTILTDVDGNPLTGLCDLE